ncbi:MAG: Mrp/NBP35 family ATP-binding protein [Flavobacteriales bacterium]
MYLCVFIYAMDKEQLIKALRHVFVSGTQGNIVDNGTLQNLQTVGEVVVVELLLYSPAMHIKKKAEVDILKAIHQYAAPKAKVKINIQVDVQEKPKTRDTKVPGVKNVIAIASGKGGVGKSTVAANIAIALAEMGFQIGLLDADIYGPSIPVMFDMESARPIAVHIDGKEKIRPVDNYGVKVLSLGFFAGANQAVVWRGPMATKALRQLIHDTHWGTLDFLIIDLPPGTGDIHLSLVQELPLTGAVIVSTPQKVALADARKAIAMFRLEAVKVPVLGLIENMAYFTPEELPNHKYYLFGKEGVQQLSTNLKIPFLGEIPIIQSIREAADVGRPAILQDNTPSAETFKYITRNTVNQLVSRNKELPPTEALRITTMAGCIAK